MLTRAFPSRRVLSRLLLVAIVLVVASGCAGPITSQPNAPKSSVDDQLAELAASAGESTATRVASPKPGDVRPAATRTPSGPAAAAASPRPTRRPAATPAAQPATPVRATRTPDDGLPTIARSQLPREAQRTITLIQQGGPFPYDKDGATFGNREGLLPKRPSGYYKEYTVVTPGSRDRGARRIVGGAGGELYYTDDHYDSFKRVIP